MNRISWLRAHLKNNRKNKFSFKTGLYLMKNLNLRTDFITIGDFQNEFDVIIMQISGGVFSR